MHPDIHAAFIILSSGRASEALLWDRYPERELRWVRRRHRRRTGPRGQEQ